MEQNIPAIAKRIWNVVRAMFFMLRKGISKGKLLVDLDLMLKRGKNLVFHHHHGGDRRHAVSSAPRHYEFSCTTTPSYSFLSKKKYHHRPPSSAFEDQLAAAAAVLDLFNNTAVEVAAPSPYLPGFGRTPLVRSLRITDSPFPLRDDDNDDDKGLVDKAAEEFIQRFYKDLKNQRITIDCN